MAARLMSLNVKHMSLMVKHKDFILLCCCCCYFFLFFFYIFSHLLSAPIEASEPWPIPLSV